jgi:hypothetical protein
MTTFMEPLPGLLDDPLLQLQEFPARSDVHIPPLRNPFPLRALSIPSPLEPTTPGDEQKHGGFKLGIPRNDHKLGATPAPIQPADLVSTRDSKKSDLTIRALLDSSHKDQLPRLLPPSFVNLAAVENSPSTPSWSSGAPTRKRAKLEHHSEYLQLPVPRQKDVPIRIPLLPAIVNGIHEPPPSAALLPPMELEEVKAMLADMSGPVTLPPEKMLNPAEPERWESTGKPSGKVCIPVQEAASSTPSDTKTKSKAPRSWNKWSNEETQKLLKGVAKHGVGRWKEICADPELNLPHRRPTDLKDRFRICFPSSKKVKGNAKFSSCGDRDAPTVPLSTQEDRLTLAKSSSDVSQVSETTKSPTSVDRATTLLSTSSPDILAAIESRAHQRVRKLWTDEEHDNLIKGFGKHGYQWTAIRNDQELGLSRRKATDIRDKFRSLYPQQYMDADSGAPIGKKTNLTQPSSSDDAPKPHLSIGSSAAVAVAAATLTTTPVNPTPTQRLSRPKVTNSTPSSSFSLNPSTKPPPPSRVDEGSVRDGPGMLDTVPETTLATTLNLPSLTLGDNDWDWDDNTLAPLLDWEDLGL